MSTQKWLPRLQKEILDVCKQERYSPYEATCNAMIKYALSKSPVDYEMVAAYLDKLDPNPFKQRTFRTGRPQRRRI